jgi:uncharacterized membrane protein required for colicin V production
MTLPQSLPQLHTNWFDAACIIFFGVGLFVGKKRGMSNELLDVFSWLLIVVVGALYYKPLGQALAKAASLSLMWSYLICYTGIALATKIVFSWVKRALGEKLVGSDIFGRGEFYLGSLAGGVRFLCMIIVLLAILNARYVNKAMVAAKLKAQEQELGSAFFPTPGKIQSDILYDSMIGVFAREHLEEQLIEATDPDYSPTPKAPVGNKKREKEVWDAIGEKK